MECNLSIKNMLDNGFRNGDILVCGSGKPTHIIGNIQDKNLPIVCDKAIPCVFDTCNCVSIGSVACLSPHNISYEAYTKEIENVK